MTDVIAFATSAAVGGVTDDDGLLARELEHAGYRVEPAVWDVPTDWSRFAAVVVRSTWDYHLRADDFLRWLDVLESSGVPVWNPAPLMRWNSDKAYLRDLDAQGVKVVPTRWIDQHEQTSLLEIVERAQWEYFVVKPRVSASAHRTWRGRIGEASLLEGNFRAAVTHGGVLVQPFLEAVTTEGEWSLMFYGGVFSHSVLKRPRADDFRVQREHGGTSTPLEAHSTIIEGALSALHAAEELHGASLYARVDGCVIAEEFVLMELELIEPDLFLRAHPEAPGRLGEAVLERLLR